jgi:hypothetical protein
LSRAKATHISGRTSPSDPLKFGTYASGKPLGNARTAAPIQRSITRRSALPDPERMKVPSAAAAMTA